MWPMPITHAVTTTIDIAAAPQSVYAVLTDVEAYDQWNPFIVEAAGTVAPGERLRLRMAPAQGRAMTFKPKVLVAEPARELRWLGSLGVRGIFDGEHSFTLTPTTTGTRLTQSETFRGVLVPFLGSLIERTEGDFDRLNAALKRRAEAV